MHFSQFSPIGGTSFPIVIVHHEHSTIEAMVSYMSEDDFRRHVDTAIDLVQLDDEGRELMLSALKKDPSFSLVRILRSSAV